MSGIPVSSQLKFDQDDLQVHSICELIPDTEGHEGEGINWFRPAQNEHKPRLKASDLELIEAIDS